MFFCLTFHLLFHFFFLFLQHASARFEMEEGSRDTYVLLLLLLSKDERKKMSWAPRVCLLSVFLALLLQHAGRPANSQVASRI